MSLVELLKDGLDRVNGWIEHSDSKISILLGIELVAFGWAIERGKDARDFYTWLTRGERVFLIILVIWFVTAIFVSLLQGYKALRPRLIPPKEATRSLLYYRTIAEMDLATFKERVGTLEEKEIAEELAEQVWVNSKIAKAKFEAVQISIDAFLLAVISLGLILAWMVVKGWE